METEMQATIQSYWEVIESQQQENSGDSWNIRQQLVEQQNHSEKLQKQIDVLNERLLLLEDENKSLGQKLGVNEQVILKLNSKLTEAKKKNGIPESEAKSLRETIEKSAAEISNFKSLVSQYEEALQKNKKIMQKLETEK